MSAPERKRVTVDNLPPEVTAELVADYAESDMSMNDIVAAILADRYKLPWEPSGRRPRWNPDDRLILKVSEEMWHRVKLDSVRRKQSMRVTIIDILSDHYRVAA